MTDKIIDSLTHDSARSLELDLQCLIVGKVDTYALKESTQRGNNIIAAWTARFNLMFTMNQYFYNHHFYGNIERLIF